MRASCLYFFKYLSSLVLIEKGELLVSCNLGRVARRPKTRRLWVVLVITVLCRTSVLERSVPVISMLVEDMDEDEGGSSDERASADADASVGKVAE